MIAICIFGLVAFYYLYYILKLEFDMFVYLSLPIAQPVLLLIVLLTVPFLFMAIQLMLRKKLGVIVTILWCCLWLGTFLFLILVPPTLLLPLSPNVVPDSGLVLRTKPNFMAHRLGASLGPENTLCALRKTIELANSNPNQIFGVECDLRYTGDAVPILLHDTTFRRTTNIASFNNGADTFTPPYRFNFSEVEQLDAGSWFVDSNPYSTIGSEWLSVSEAEQYRGCKIPTFREVLLTIRNSTQNNLKIMWNVRGPRPELYNLQLCLIISATGMSQNVFWLTDFNEAFPDLQNVTNYFCPGVTFALASDVAVNETYVESAQAVGFEYLNLPLQTPNVQLEKTNITKIVYQCNSLWLFNQLWLAGNVDLITSNVVQNFFVYNSTTVWTISRSGYIALFVVVDVIAVAALVAIVLYYYFQKLKIK
jgi:hypothetical protein